MSWREKFRVHPVADVFPMMSPEELDALGEDIRRNGLKQKITLLDDGDPQLLDGRNRIEAAERAGIELKPDDFKKVYYVDPVAYVTSLNINRRHMKPEKIAAVLVDLAKIELGSETAPRGEVSKGGRGKLNPVKAKAVELNKALPKETQVGQRTIERAIAKTEGREPAPRRAHSTTAQSVSLKAARDQYAAEFAKLPVGDETAEFKRLGAAINRARGGQ